MTDHTHHVHTETADAEHARVYAFPTATGGQAEPTDPSEVLEAELVDDTTTPSPVDQPDTPGTEPARSASESVAWRPVLPTWLSDREEFREATRWALAYVGHSAAYHAVRCPVYVARVLARVPHGSWRLLQGLVRWVTDAEGRPVRHAAARREDASEYLKLATQRDGRVRARSVVACGLSVAGVAAVLTGHALLPALAEWAVVATAVAGLGWLGAPADQPVVSRAVESTKAPKLTSNIVETALASLGISQINQALAKGGSGIGFPKPISRDGKGWRADVDLPPGATPGDVLERRGKLASGLRRPVGCVWPESDPSEHAGRLVLWVGDKDMRKAKQPTWPLRNGSAVDLFQPQPFGTNQRGRWVDLTLMFVSVAIGSIPRMGKTFALRELLLIAALDPRAELHTYDLKGTGDLDPLEKVTHRHGVGDEPEEIEAALTDMRGLRDELRRRARLIRDLAKKGQCPENKVTPELANKTSLGLHPIVIGVDECQVWFEHDQHGDELEDICTDLVKRGPALGIVLILATQRPDAKSLPTGISANVSTRFCLKVQGQTENDMVLGTSKYKQGVRATTFAWEDKGIGYLVGEGADADIVRTVAGLDGPTSEKIAAHARTLRHHAGTLSGHAIGQAPEPDETRRDTLLEDILTVVPETEKKVWNERVIPRLVELRPEAYGTYSKAEDLTAALKRHDIHTGQVWGTTDDGKGASRIGITRADIAKTVAQRNRRGEAS
ncbi:DNA segregation ATPase FtsK/SpoIIIE, S-DNA-T family [Actinopolyspora xinjiangensis]|uniref:DNA segregation ATPase FtsK/SpoIIIE, S-DNA-T family n=1 Tax=Actinopolyspora xinjiangensis TaxID=405564 RepID=A0A1H0WBJ4_9ACTN|nr:FtsK/SpoIIIE domain-containing protein [Actinopolyspora xinjiangensis]SDP87911.1 DNA segregation ATPase FtsK/SpoIIIE, S-DNA-T family [Actinopolyspora xinjiangensis]